MVWTLNQIGTGTMSSHLARHRDWHLYGCMYINRFWLSWMRLHLQFLRYLILFLIYCCVVFGRLSIIFVHKPVFVVLNETTSSISQKFRKYSYYYNIAVLYLKCYLSVRTMYIFQVLYNRILFGIFFNIKVKTDMDFISFKFKVLILIYI